MPTPIPAVVLACARSVREVLLPALDPDNAPAHDQGRILLATLEMLAEHATLRYDYVLRESSDYSSLVAAIAGRLEERSTRVEAGLAEEARALLEAAAPVIAQPPPPLSDLEELCDRLRAAADGLLSLALAEHGADSVITDAVLEQARRQVCRERLWAAGSGFDAEAATLPGLREHLRARTGPAVV